MAAKGGESDLKALAIQLGKAIRKGNDENVKDVVDHVTEEQYKDFELEFFNCQEGHDPVIVALWHDQEDIAIWLIEKGYRYSRSYNYPGQSCNHQCYYDHGADPCPTEFTALQLAIKNNLSKAADHIRAIQSGDTTAGQLLDTLEFPRQKPKVKPKSTKTKTTKSSKSKSTTSTKTRKPHSKTS